MRLRCYYCGKSVSNEVPEDTIVRAILECPECIEEGVREKGESQEEGSRETLYRQSFSKRFIRVYRGRRF